MRAIEQKTYGSPDVLTLVQREAPAPGPREVLVEVAASVVTQGDRRLRAGDFPGIMWLPGRLMMGLTGPRKPTPGTAFAGRVVAIGAEVTRFAVGDDVFGGVMNGAWVDRLAVREDGAIAKMPSGMDYRTAAALPYGGITSLVFLGEIGKVSSGDRVCIIGASGGVGRMAVQLAKHLGAEVTAVCGAESHALVKELGADHVVDYRVEDFRDGREFDVVFDTVGASNLAHSRRALSERGRYLGLMVSARRIWQALTSGLFGKKKAKLGVAVPSKERLEQLAELFEGGVLAPRVGKTFPLEAIGKAHAHLESAPHHAVVVDFKAAA